MEREQEEEYFTMRSENTLMRACGIALLGMAGKKKAIDSNLLAVLNIIF